MSGPPAHRAPQWMSSAALSSLLVVPVVPCRAGVVLCHAVRFLKVPLELLVVVVVPVEVDCSACFHSLVLLDGRVPHTSLSLSFFLRA